ncbi:4a-hydroxytetrahydrobiopterin dehydratase [Burkholderiaceae bacterium DAT-1]|nr:4a-hydroxytetrahydrobiopterin dehydratase [Burkholderiaceae bacterium DAT-1]
MSLVNERCGAVVPALDQAGIEALLKEVSGWAFEGGKIVKTFRFANYHESVAFVNAGAWIANKEDHHPEVFLTYNTVRVAFDTHSCNGISRNDFICAAKYDALVA